MAVPYNKSHVDRALAKLVSSGVNLSVPSSEFESTRARCLPYIWAEFPDKSNWRLMRKTEKGTRHVQPDVMWYLPTGEHVDVLTGDDLPGGKVRVRSAWTNQGISPRQTDGRWIPITVLEADLAPFSFETPHIDVPPPHVDAPSPVPQPSLEEVLIVLKAIQEAQGWLAQDLSRLERLIASHFDISTQQLSSMQETNRRLNRAYVGRLGYNIRLTPEEE